MFLAYVCESVLFESTSTRKQIITSELQLTEFLTLLQLTQMLPHLIKMLNVSGAAVLRDVSAILL